MRAALPTPTEIAELADILTVELTTIGRRSGRPARIEIWWFYIEKRFVITGTPRPRDWFANIGSHPGVIIHANGADYAAVGRVINDEVFRRRVLTDPVTSWYRSRADLAEMIGCSPMVEIDFSSGLS
ncbi:MAG: nitroreductase/quinone reductase family protein [Ilumatobacter sp.]|nr:nitroreductase/quinone reductase family protein [Ilumatobacter sp.]